jgi:hypothetical protein
MSQQLKNSSATHAHDLNSANACAVHGHNHAAVWSRRLPIVDLKSFWGALGCAC